MTNTERNVAIVGAGLIGRAWAAIFARAGWNVRLTDPHIPTLKAAPRLIRDELHALARHGLAADPDGAVARVSVAASLQEAVLGRRIRPGERAGEGRGQARDLRPARPAGAAGCAAGVLDLGDRGLALHRGAAGPRALPGRPSRQSAASGAAGRTLRRAVDLARGDRARAKHLSRDRAGAGHHQPRDQRLCAQPAAGRAAGRSVSPGRRRLYLGGGSRSHRQGRPRPALVVPRAVRDHRTQRARRHSRLLRALHRLLQGAGFRRRRARSLSKPECRPGDRGMAASADAGTHRRA